MMNKGNETQAPIESEFNKLNISDSVTINHENCDPWCKECIPSCIIEGWTSGNDEIDNFIKNTICNARSYYGYSKFLEWVSFDFCSFDGPDNPKSET